MKVLLKLSRKEENTLVNVVGDYNGDYVIIMVNSSQTKISLLKYSTPLGTS